MIKSKHRILFLLTLLLVGLWSFFSSSYAPEIGDPIDQHNGVVVYYNGKKFTNTHGRNLALDGYNLGLKWQCVEYVKRYYYEYYGHKMPNASGNARDFFDRSLGDKGFNKKRGLMQYRNTRVYKPKEGDLLVFDSYQGNPYGHVAIISKVGPSYVEIIQQNLGQRSREKVELVEYAGYYTIAKYDILGWLRKE
jgi:surface antigen